MKTFLAFVLLGGAGCFEVSQELGFDPHVDPAADAALPEAGTAADAGTDRGAAAPGVRGIAVLKNRACVVLANGLVKCWGANADEQSGAAGVEDSVVRGDSPGEMGELVPAVRLGTGRKAQSVVGGDSHGCALLEGGSVKCWGRNEKGQLGLGDAVPRGADRDSMGDKLAAVDLGSGVRVTELAAARQTSCAVVDEGALVCWGSGERGYRGSFDADGGLRDYGLLASDMGSALPRVDLGSGLRARHVSMASSGGCAVLQDGRLKCWGFNLFGNLGLGDQTDRRTAAAMGDALPFVSLGTGRTTKIVARGIRSSCAILDDDTVRCWGSNDRGQLGYEDRRSRGGAPGDMGDALPAVRLGAGRTALAIAVGEFDTADDVGFAYACALLDDGRVKCWGSGGAQLGQGDVRSRGDTTGSMGDALQAVDLGSGAGSRAVAIATDSGAVCALLVDGRVKCWGNGDLGRLGLGDTRSRGGAPGEMGDALPAVDLGQATATSAAP